MKRVYFVSYLIMLCTLGVVDAEALGKRHPGEVPEDRAAKLGVDDSAPVDLGWGPGRGRPSARTSIGPTSGIQPAAEGFREFDAAALTPPPDAHIKGVFGDPFTWPIIPIHAALLPDGKVHSYGTSTTGAQGAALVHALWDPELGTAASAHTLLPNTTPTDTLCAAQALLPNSGQLLITGGDTTVNGNVHFGTADTNIYDYTTNKLSSVVPMAYKRWYPTLVAQTNGALLVLGGRQETIPLSYAPTPEVYTPGAGWRRLTTATNQLAYGSSYDSWNYPRAFPAPNGQVFILAHHGEMFYLNPTGTGSIKRATKTLAPISYASLPIVSFAPGKILSLRINKKAIIVDLNKTPPTFKATASVSSLRYWSNATVVADGNVVVTGGSAVANTLTNVAYKAEIWDPVTGKWTLGAAAQKPRLYHSSAVLLPDATILTMGGGAPGPVKNLNAEVFYPPYLWEPGGLPAIRPSIVSAPGTVVLGNTFYVEVGDVDSIERVTLVRNGSVTHSFDAATSFTELSFIQNGTNLTVTAPNNANVAMPGYWMMFVINENGVPSVAKTLRVTRT